MKSILTIVFAGITVVSVFASGNLRVNVVPLEREMAEVAIFNVKSSTFNIEVKDETGAVIFSKATEVPSTNYKRNYDFSQMEDGTYFLTVKVDNEIKETKLEIKNGEVNVLKVTKSMAPVFQFNNKELKMSYLNFEGEDSRLLVYDKNRQLLYEKELNREFVLHHGLDFSSTMRGNYEVVLSSGNKVYSYDIFVE